MEKINIVEFFDPSDEEHMKAYKYLRDTGVWPRGFISDNIIFEPYWYIHMLHKLVGYLLDKYEK
jgi:hypothetical protein